ncbi:Zn(II)2Cys6 transcription factor domain-containing protein [Aspergillus aculeatinus CBS 121060]|uniref:Uncharacterized protein n=1 Tax=Aspergillus aculeatinus CBS 121060 TaxID=1448322 RepID=A0ACD1H1F0_9EURO|nr:hypothetical protein BO66DRAFT_422252 [Aspergillus aculeatinus CBS 121060]RAH67251.1 hypothetical protein BO66DRAFT_422252 [Aspergillus aculeatinus CBS 121060]
MEPTAVDKRAERAECPFCATTFTHRSSLIRHLRMKCNQPQPQTVRRKACSQCVADKTRCNLKRPSCSRCSMRQIPCQYPNPFLDSSDSPSPDREETTLAPQVNPSSPPEPQAADSSSLFEALLADSAPWDLSFPFDVNSSLSPRRISAALVRNDNAQIYPHGMICENPSSLVSPEPNALSPAAALANHSMEFIFRVLRSWPRMLAGDFQTPPFIHHSSIADDRTLPQSLANCFTLVKMWHGQCHGAENLVHRLILNEVNSLLNKLDDLDEASLLAILQAVVIYLIILLFPGESSRPTLPPPTLLHKIQDLANHAANTGLFLQEEREAMRPTWTAWVHVTSKRRAVLSLYLLRWALSVFHDAPPLDCRQVGFMPAPAAKILWQAKSEPEWNSLYIRWLARWDGHGYIQGEFDQIRPGIKMAERAEKWLEEADEFGMIMMSIVNATDCPLPTFAVH